MDGTGVRFSDDSAVFATADDVLPDVVWNGTAFVGVWEADYADSSLPSEIWAYAWVPNTFSSPLVGVIGSSGGHSVTEPSIASAGKTLLVVYTYEAPNSIGEDIHATRVEATGSSWPTNDFVVARAAGDQDARPSPSTASSWRSGRTGERVLGRCSSPASNPTERCSIRTASRSAATTPQRTSGRPSPPEPSRREPSPSRSSRPTRTRPASSPRPSAPWPSSRGRGTARLGRAVLVIWGGDGGGSSSHEVLLARRSRSRCWSPRPPRSCPDRPTRRRGTQRSPGARGSRRTPATRTRRWRRTAPTPWSSGRRPPGREVCPTSMAGSPRPTPPPSTPRSGFAGRRRGLRRGRGVERLELARGVDIGIGDVGHRHPRPSGLQSRSAPRVAARDPRRAPVFASTRPSPRAPTASSSSPGRTAGEGPPLRTSMPAESPRQVSCRTGPVSGSALIP